MLTLYKINFTIIKGNNDNENCNFFIFANSITEVKKRFIKNNTYTFINSIVIYDRFKLNYPLF